MTVLTNVQPFLIGQGWMELRDGDPSARAIFDRHYSRRRYADGRVLASVMIQEAMVNAFARWPGERLYTYVNPRKVTPTLVRGLPVFGFCFYKAGWRFAGLTKKLGLWIWAFQP